ncbi:SLC5/6 family protein [Algoriphagus boritolerans]|uniref:Na+-dependent transporter, SNF family n=1 Tax=Algoriphagus boritolerans DSM 17298 = JCM 18970 TaxID=1120964 RepID=A0A1H5TKW3_9BACT|nr:sodium:calcium symporter [Algoriphagus boritolerans]SEF63414.1 Na+-dependent transporter, SNF family [Algoriphagus boritolerans DSM 17298 = JCM 18970]
MTTKNESWGSRIGLILAMAGNAVGLGNFLRFPVQAVQNGGGAFIIPYLICFLLMGIPLLFTEWSIGRFGGKLGNHSTPYILDSMSKKPIWKYIGVFGIFTNIAVVAYYTYIESWTFIYVLHSVFGTFTGMGKEEVSLFFDHYVNLTGSDLGIPFLPILVYILILGVNVYILSTGLGGIEKVAKIGMPLLVVFGIILAYQGWTMGSDFASAEFPNANAWDGINFLWTPQYDSLADPKVWLAAAGQIFFTLSVGMGSIQCYASYVRENEDIALNSLSAGFTNEFVEVLLGSAIVIPIAAGFLGLDWVMENAGFGMAFQTMPYLFQQWGAVFGAIAGISWFGLLFFAGITSSLAMGTPWMGFMKDEFGWNKVKGAISFGLIALAMGLPTVLFYQYGYFDEYDYWAGTVSLVVFALLEIILFGWVFGIDRGWAELNRGADIRIPSIYKFIIKYVTPVLLILVFIGALVTPQGNDWSGALATLLEGNGFTFDSSSLISKITQEDVKEQLLLNPDKADFFEKKMLFTNLARTQLLLLFLGITVLVWYSTLNRKRKTL